jgi:integrase
MGRKRKSFCVARVNRSGRIFFDITWNGRRWWEGTTWRDNKENLARAAAYAEKIDRAIRDGTFNGNRYLAWFPHGTRAEEFRPVRLKFERPSDRTVEGFFDEWKETLRPPKVRSQTAAQYRSAFKCHILPSLGPMRIAALTWQTLATLQDQLMAAVGAPAINRALHHALRAMLRDAKRRGVRVAANLYDKDLWQRLDENTDSTPDPYDPAEREAILEHFRAEKPEWYPFVYFQFWQGARPSEATALRRRDVDLAQGTFRVHRSRVGGAEARTKTKKSKREPRFHPGTVRVLRSAWPLGTKPDDYVFTTPRGTPVSEDNFQSRVWLPALRALKVRERPFYNTRHSYISTMISLGKKVGFVSEQTGHSILTLEKRYKKYFPSESDILIPGEEQPLLPGVGAKRTAVAVEVS